MEALRSTNEYVIGWYRTYRGKNTLITVAGAVLAFHQASQLGHRY